MAQLVNGARESVCEDLYISLATDNLATKPLLRRDRPRAHYVRV